MLLMAAQCVSPCCHRLPRMIFLSPFASIFMHVCVCVSAIDPMPDNLFTVCSNIIKMKSIVWFRFTGMNNKQHNKFRAAMPTFTLEEQRKKNSKKIKRALRRGSLRSASLPHHNNDNVRSYHTYTHTNKIIK